MKSKPSRKLTSLLLAFALAVSMVAVPSTALTASAAETPSSTEPVPMASNSGEKLINAMESDAKVRQNLTDDVNYDYIKVTASPVFFTTNDLSTTVVLTLNINHTGYDQLEVTGKFIITKESGYDAAIAGTPLYQWETMSIPSGENIDKTTDVSFAGKSDGIYYIHWYVKSGDYSAHSKDYTNPPHQYGAFGPYIIDDTNPTPLLEVNNLTTPQNIHSWAGLPVKIIFDEPVVGSPLITNFTISDNKGTISDITVSGSASKEFTATLTPAVTLTQNETFTIQLNAGAVTDIAGNQNKESNTVSLTFSQSVPTFTGGLTATTDTINLIEGYTVHNQTYTTTGIPTPTVAMTNNDGTGATVDSAGVLTIPSGLEIGTYTIVLTATNAAGNATMTVTVNVLETPIAPTVTPTSLSMQAGKTSSFAVTMGAGTNKATSVSIVSNNTAIAIVDKGVLNANGSVTVTGIAPGTANIRLTWTGGSLGGTTATVLVTVPKAAPAITTTTLPSGIVGSGYSQTLAATGAVPITWSIDSGNLPAGFTLSSGVIAGTPTTAGTSSFTLKAANGIAPDATQTYTVTITVGAQPTYAVAVTGGRGSGNYLQGATVIIIANTPPTGQKFDRWISGGGVRFANENMADTSFVMPASGVTVTATYKAIPTTAEKHTITLGASGNGTVSGGGTFDEDSNITITATADTGNSFVNWTENGVLVSISASYNFTVTASRNLVANFKADGVGPPVDPPVTPPTTPSTSRGSSDSYVGSNKVDVSPNLKPSATSNPSATKAEATKAEATKLFNAALAAKPAGQTALSFRVTNFTSAPKAMLAELAALAKKNGVTLTVHFDTVVGKAVTCRISVNPVAVTTDLDLTVKIAGNKITLPKFAVPVGIAVKLPQGLTIENLKITENGKDVATTTKPWLDKNGYVHFTTTGGEILLGK